MTRPLIASLVAAGALLAASAGGPAAGDAGRLRAALPDRDSVLIGHSVGGRAIRALRLGYRDARRRRSSSASSMATSGPGCGL